MQLPMEPCPACGKPGGWVNFQNRPPGLYHLRCGVKARFAYASALRGRTIEASDQLVDALVDRTKRRLRRTFSKLQKRGEEIEFPEDLN